MVVSSCGYRPNDALWHEVGVRVCLLMGCLYVWPSVSLRQYHCACISVSLPLSLCHVCVCVCVYGAHVQTS